MFYRSSDSNFSTHDWFRINTSSIPQMLIVGEKADRFEDLTEIHNEEEVEVPDWHVDLNEEDEQFGIKLFSAPERDDYASANAETNDDGPILTQDEINMYEEDLLAWQKYDEAAREAIGEREHADMLPMWGTMFNVEDHPLIRANCFKVGLRLYEHPLIDGLLIGVDSAGHSFYDSYWIKLRALFAAEHMRYSTRNENKALYDLLLHEWKKEGGTYAEKELDQILGRFLTSQVEETV